MTLVEQIRPLLSARDPRAVEGAVDIAGRYLAQIRSLSDRLARCADFLRRGLRSEAVHLAECHPNLLSTVDDLQIPDAPPWDRLCDSLGLAAPVEMNPETLDELRSACEVEQSLASLLSQHRTLAVGRAPVRQRLAVLYALADIDPETASWRDDIRLLEAERASALAREYKAAVRAADLPALESLGDEVAQTPWRTPLPRDLVSRIQKSARTCRRDALIARIRALIPRLAAVPDGANQGECAKLLDEWHGETSPEAVREMDLPDDLLAQGEEAVLSATTWLTAAKRLRLNDKKISEETPGRKARSPRRRALKWILIAFVAVLLAMSVLAWLAPEKFRLLARKFTPVANLFHSMAGEQPKQVARHRRS